MSRRAKNVVCPYCFKRARFMYDSEPLFGENRGPHYHCDPCQAYVGCHRNSNKPLGTLARFELRRGRIQAHDAFDPLWRDSGMSRDDAYLWLAEKLGVDPGQCHIAMFNEKMCRQVVQVCRKRFADKFMNVLKSGTT